MRLLLLMVASLSLLGCTAAPMQPNETAPFNAPFEAPMDPGTIQCRSLTSPAALEIATDWAMGQARAAVMSGNLTDVPDRAAMADSLTRYCGVNPSDSIADAIGQSGI